MVVVTMDSRERSKWRLWMGRRGKEGEEEKEEWLGRYKLSSSLMFVAPSCAFSATTL